MKKTLITILALAGLAHADFDPTLVTSYSATFANETNSTTTTSVLTFGNEESLALKSWCIEFTTTAVKTSGSHILMSSSGSDSVGVCLDTWGPSGATRNFGVKVNGNSSTGAGSFKSVLSTNAGGASQITMRLAYDNQNMTYYVMSLDDEKTLTTGTFITADSSDYYLTSGVSKFSVYGTNSYTVTAVYDLTDVAKAGATGKADFAAFVANPTTVPEPATATLSLLALAGLAARRRRH